LPLATLFSPAKQEKIMPFNQAKLNPPPFPPTLDWLNTPRPLSLAELRGKLVLLEFFTYG
jgi:hypothetical protein